MVAGAHLLYCLSQAESKNYDVLPGLVLTAKRYLKNHFLENEASTALLNLLLQYDRMGRREQMKAWKEYQATFFSDQKTQPELLDRISIYHWISSKVKNYGV